MVRSISTRVVVVSLLVLTWHRDARMYSSRVPPASSTRYLVQGRSSDTCSGCDTELPCGVWCVGPAVVRPPVAEPHNAFTTHSLTSLNLHNPPRSPSYTPTNTQTHTHKHTHTHMPTHILPDRLWFSIADRDLELWAKSFAAIHKWDVSVKELEVPVLAVQVRDERAHEESTRREHPPLLFGRCSSTSVQLVV